jgi:hypothetical protein
MAAADELDDEAGKGIEALLRERLGEMIRSGTLNPWCGLCEAGIKTWCYETTRTGFRTMTEAMPELRRLEAEQRLIAAAFGGSAA